jgi:thioredoxin-related protein
MKKQLKAFMVLVILCCLSVVSFGQEAIAWNEDMIVASEQAENEGKMILLSFSGSDWCANCIRLDKVLFQSEEFASLASEEFVLLNADFPARSKNKLSKEQTAKNEALAEKYNKGGVFPTVVVLSADGNVVGKLVHPKDSVEEYITQLHAFVD